MARKKMVAPSILSADFANLGAEVQAVTEAGADWIHVDVMDGHFVDNITIGVPVVQSLKKFAKIPLDVHLMIEQPEKYVRQFIEAGSNNVTIHVESTKDPVAVLKEIRRLGAKPGITLRPRTALEKILPYLELVDLVLVMTVEPGFSGQSFMPEQVTKVNELRKIIDQKKLNCLIEVDGGVNEKTVHELGNADVLVSGNYVFKNDYKKSIATLKGKV